MKIREQLQKALSRNQLGIDWSKILLWRLPINEDKDKQVKINVANDKMDNGNPLELFNANENKGINIIANKLLL